MKNADVHVDVDVYICVCVNHVVHMINVLLLKACCKLINVLILPMI